MEGAKEGRKGEGSNDKNHQKGGGGVQRRGPSKKKGTGTEVLGKKRYAAPE